MKEFENGVRFYTKGYATITVNFPEKEVKCKWCPFCRAERELGRYWCRLTNKMLYDPESYELGRDCPLEFEEVEDDGNIFFRGV